LTQIIVDVCNNHLGYTDILNRMIRMAAKYGADYVKFQLYNPNLLNPSYPNYKQIRANYLQCTIGLSMLHNIFSICEETNISPMFTIFSIDRLDLLEEFDNFTLKIASPDMSNYELIDACVKKYPNKLILISTGMHKTQEIIECREKYKANKNIKFLYCISQYPTPIKDIDWHAVPSYSGFSDHTKGIEAAKQVLGLNLDYLEFHFTLGKYLPGKDHMISKTPDELLVIYEYRKYINTINQYKTRWKEG